MVGVVSDSCCGIGSHLPVFPAPRLSSGAEGRAAYSVNDFGEDGFPPGRRTATCFLYHYVPGAYARLVRTDKACAGCHTPVDMAYAFVNLKFDPKPTRVSFEERVMRCPAHGWVRATLYDPTVGTCASPFARLPTICN
jgi:hypothetical protein